MGGGGRKGKKRGGGKGGGGEWKESNRDKKYQKRNRSLITCMCPMSFSFESTTFSHLLSSFHP